MFKLIEFFQKRPKDSTILFGRVFFGLLIAILIGLNFYYIKILHLPDFVQPYEFYKKCGLFIFVIIPIFMGLSGLCIAKRKYVRIMQISFGVLLMVTGTWFIDTQVPTMSENPIITTQSDSLDYGTLAEVKHPSNPINVGFWLTLLGFLPLIAGISGKCITSKCLKYGEVIKKIRV